MSKQPLCPHSQAALQMALLHRPTLCPWSQSPQREQPLPLVAAALASAVAFVEASATVSGHLQSQCPRQLRALPSSPWADHSAAELSSQVQQHANSPGASAFGGCYFCGKACAAGQGEIVARHPIVKLQCKECKRIDQAVGRSFGSVQWLRDLPFARAQAFYVQCAGLPP